MKVDSGFRGFEYQDMVRQLKRIANWTCARCGYHAEEGSFDRVNILVHHIDRNPFNHNLNNLEVICDNCHHQLTWGKLEEGAKKVDAHYPESFKKESTKERI